MRDGRKRPKHSRLHYSASWNAHHKSPSNLGTPGADPRKEVPTDFSYMSSPPASPEIAYLWRRFVSAHDAISYFRFDDPGLPASVSDPQVAAHEAKKIHQDLHQRELQLHMELQAAFLPIYAADAARVPRPPEVQERVRSLREQIDDVSGKIHALISRRALLEQHLTRHWRAEAGKRILEALGKYPFDYPGARKALRDWCDEALVATGQKASSRDSEDPRDLARYQLQEVIEPLLDAYENPELFFQERLQDLTFYLLTEENFRGTDHLGTWTDGRYTWPFTYLAEILHRWGYGVLLNPNVRAIFEKAASEPTFSLVLAQAEGKRAFLDVGPPLKVNYDALRREYAAIPRGKGERAKWKIAKAKELAVKSYSLDRYLRPSFRKKP